MSSRNKITPRHSGYSFLTHGVVPCDPCVLRSDCERFQNGGECSILAEFQETKIREIMALPHIRDEDIFLVRMLVRELAFQVVVSRYLSKIGLVLLHENELSPQPILKLWLVSVNAARRMCDQLGLSPKSRRQLGLERSSRGDFASGVVAAKEEIKVDKQ